MLLEPQNLHLIQPKKLIQSSNPQENHLKTSRFHSPFLKLRRVRSLKFFYKSPSHNSPPNNQGPLKFNKQAHNIVVRRLPAFHEQIFQTDPLKNTNIIQNINHVRETKKGKKFQIDLEDKLLQVSRVSINQFQVNRVLVDLKYAKAPQQKKLRSSLSYSYVPQDDSMISVIEHSKRGENLYKNIMKQQRKLLESRFFENKESQKNIKMAQSRYFSGMLD